MGGSSCVLVTERDLLQKHTQQGMAFRWGS